MAKHDKIGSFRIVPNKQRGGYQVDIPAHLSETGRRQRPLFATKAAAKKEAERRTQILSDRALGQAAGQVKKAGIDLHALATQWTTRQYRQVELGKKKASSLETSIYYLDALTRHMGNTDIAQFDERILEDYQENRLNEDKSPATINSEIALLKSILKYAREKGKVDKLPSVSALPVDEIIPDLPTVQEMQLIITCIDPKHRVLLLLMAETGCRKNEAQTLPWEHVNEVRGTIRFQKHVNADGEKWTTKRASSIREVPISQDLLDEIRSLEKVSEYVFPGRDKSKPLNNFRKSLKAAIIKSSVERNGEPIHVTPQIIRKAVLTWHIENGTPESVVQALCGHALGSRVTQKAYIRHGQAALKNAIIPMSPAGQNENENNLQMATKPKATSNDQQEYLNKPL